MPTPVHIVRRHWRRLNKPILRRAAKERDHKAEVEARAEARKKARQQTSYAAALETLRLIEANPSPSAVSRLLDMKNSHPDRRVNARAAAILLKWASNPLPRKKRQKEKW